MSGRTRVAKKRGVIATLLVFRTVVTGNLLRSGIDRRGGASWPWP
jgi:hypothetical protein